MHIFLISRSRTIKSAIKVIIFTTSGFNSHLEFLSHCQIVSKMMANDAEIDTQFRYECQYLFLKFGSYRSDNLAVKKF